MHILIAIIGIVTAISVWYWRIKMISDAARGGADLAKSAANLPRRLKFKRQAGQGGLKLVDDPREAAAIIMLEIARAGGEVSRDHKAVMTEQMVRDFELSQDDAEALIAHAAWLTRNAPAAHAVISRMSDFVLRVPGIGPKQIVDLDSMLVAVSEAEGTPSREQLSLLQVFRDKVELKT
ncbi:MAG: hypothetical protein AAFW65_05450 [Pseudomonadota bacterium]